MAGTCDGLAIGWRLVIVQLPVTDLLDRRFASRHHQVDHGLEPNGQNGVRFLNWHSVPGLILSYRELSELKKETRTRPRARIAHRRG